MAYDTDQQKDNFLSNLYYKEHYQVGRDLLFYHVSKKLGITNISRRYILNWLSKQKSQQVFQNPKKQTSIKPLLVSKPGFIAIDLLDFSKQGSFGNYNYVLNFIDQFSRKIWLVPLRNKTSKLVDKNLEKLILEYQKHYNITAIISDNGGEFDSNKIYDKYNIKHLTTQSYTPQQNSIAERAGGTVKSILKKVLYNENTKNWVKYIKEIQDIYNTTLNRNLKKSPDEIFFDTSLHEDTFENLKTNHAKSYKEVDTVLEIGDSVRVLIQKKSKLDKQQTYSEEIYKINKVIKGNSMKFTINRYQVKDDLGNVLKGNYPLSKLLKIPV
jgi:hypothetical protein